MQVADARHWSTQDVAQSYARWWRDAGLHSLCSDTAHGWLTDDPVSSPASDPVETHETAVRFDAAHAEPVKPSVVAEPAMPDSLAAFAAWLIADPSQPDVQWDGPAFTPATTEGLKLLVICDMPEAGAEGPTPFAPPASAFVNAMLRSIGLDRDQVGFATLASRRPRGGLMDDKALSALAQRMRHFLELARPSAALILGDRTSRALFAASDASPAGALQDIHHSSGKVGVAALPSPDLLMRRPRAKAASWQTLRLLQGRIEG